jgi:EAL domain-containing protein (putative c-di-GMP-specific phosphodiesterase class I)
VSPPAELGVYLLAINEKNKGLAAQMIFSISSYAVAKEVDVYKEFIEFIHSLGAQVMIKRFETQSMSPEVAKELNPDYIRLARGLGNGVANEEGKQIFIEAMQGVGELLDISILAENVESDQDYEFIN